MSPFNNFQNSRWIDRCSFKEILYGGQRTGFVGPVLATGAVKFVQPIRLHSFGKSSRWRYSSTIFFRIGYIITNV